MNTAIHCGELRLINRKHGSTRTPCGDVHILYIGRPSVLGNPIVLKREAERGSTLERYEAYLRAQCRRDTPVRRELIRIARLLLSGVTVWLECFCTPLLMLILLLNSPFSTLFLLIVHVSHDETHLNSTRILAKVLIGSPFVLVQYHSSPNPYLAILMTTS